MGYIIFRELMSKSQHPLEKDQEVTIFYCDERGFGLCVHLVACIESKSLLDMLTQEPTSTTRHQGSFRIPQLNRQEFEIRRCRSPVACKELSQLCFLYLVVNGPRESRSFGLEYLIQ